MLASRAGNEHISASWYEDPGDFRLLVGKALTSFCEPHFHETPSIAYIRKGSALVGARGCDVDCQRGAAILVNAYEIVSCCGSDDFDYDVCYLSPDFMAEVAERIGQRGAPAPKFVNWKISGAKAQELGDILASLCRRSGESGPSPSIEDELMRFISANPWMLEASQGGARGVGCVVQACELIERLWDEPITIDELSRRVRASRSYFVRSFREVTGLPPSYYIRQLRLARGLQQIRQGHQLAEVALVTGFADQAHFTREFKRLYGTTPGKLVRDIGKGSLPN